MARKAALIALVFLLTCCKYLNDGNDNLPGAGPEDYNSGSQSYGPPQYFIDVNKGPFDNKLCWAASAANALTSSGWAGDEDDVFQTLKGHFGNVAGCVYDAIEWYLRNFNFNESVHEVAIAENNPSKAMLFTTSQLRLGRSLIHILKNPNGLLHDVSVYGFETLADGYNIYFVCSNDGRHILKRTVVKLQDGKWVWKNYFPGWVISRVISIKNRGDNR